MQNKTQTLFIKYINIFNISKMTILYSVMFFCQKVFWLDKTLISFDVFYVEITLCQFYII